MQFLSKMDKHQFNLPHLQSTDQPADKPDLTSSAQASMQQAAATAARLHIEQAYQKAPPNQLKDKPTTLEDPYNKTYNKAPQTYDWGQYHTAWQKYYQLYYQRYYLQQAHQQRQQSAAQKAQALIEDQKSIPETQTLKTDLLARIANRSISFKQSNHFWPVISALSVIFVFLFLQYNRVLVADVNAYISPGSTVNANDTILVDPSNNVNVGPEPKLIIPKINVNIKVVYGITSAADGPVQEGLKKGVVHYNLPGANSLPGQIGNTVILGHSSNDIFDPGDYKFAFVLLDRMQAGDIFYIHYNNIRYIYKVTGSKIIDPTEISALQVKTDKPIATLVTCTPPGTALKRLLVTGEQISPNPAAASSQPASSTPAATDALPGNSTTFFDKIWNFFF